MRSTLHHSPRRQSGNLRQADIIHYLFLDHLDFAHGVPYLALGISLISPLSVQFPARDKCHTLSAPQTSSLQSFFAQKGLMIACIIACFKIGRQEVLVFSTGVFGQSLLALTHLCNLVGWLNMNTLLPIVLQTCSSTTGV